MARSVVTLERYHFDHAIELHEMDVAHVPHGRIREFVRENYYGGLVARLQLTVLAHTYELIPRSWWQHFKQDCFPKWVLRRWPVKYNGVKLVVTAPPKGDLSDAIDRSQTPYVQMWQMSREESDRALYDKKRNGIGGLE